MRREKVGIPTSTRVESTTTHRQQMGTASKMTSLAACCQSEEQRSGPVRDTPPHIAQYPFEIVSQRAVSHAFCLVFIGYRASIAEIPLLRGGWQSISKLASARLVRAMDGAQGKTRRGGGGQKNPDAHKIRAQ